MKKTPLFACILLLMALAAVSFAVLPGRTYSALENRMLAGAPALSSLFGSGFDEAMEAFASDHFPLRDQLVSARTALLRLSGARRIDDTLLGSGGWLFEIVPEGVTRNAALCMQTLEEVSAVTGLPHDLMLIETSAQALPHRLPRLAHVSDQEKTIDALYAMAERVRPLYTTLPDQPDGETLYYRTDHHLTADGAQVVYERICGAWGLAPQAAPRFEAEGFLGSYYAKAPGAWVGSETMSVSLPEGIRVMIDGEEKDGLIDRTALEGRNKYAAVLAQTYAHVQLINENAQGSLLILCDSYANAVAPLLAQHFGRVDMVDPRYFTGTLSALCGEAGTQRILTLMGLNIFSENRGLLLMDVGGE
ncbi:MAG: hypothetical protein IJD60_06245 [Clostridia bacterium]|nr:hypothetical protein [Clostridia bacterium]